MAARDVLYYQNTDRHFLGPYLPPPLPSPDTYEPVSTTIASPYPHVTLTYAQSLDGAIAAAPGVQTALSGPESKAMTHYLRSQHDGILVGVGTALADDPSLNCRLEGVGGYGGEGLKRQPRPIILDPWIRWASVAESSKVMRLAREGKGRAPWVIVGWHKEGDVIRRGLQLDALLETVGGRVISISPRGHRHLHEGERLYWEDVLWKLRVDGIESLMVEGGAKVIEGLLTMENRSLISSVIITVAPVWLGKGSLMVGLEQEPQEEDSNALSMAKMVDTTSHHLGVDIVVCGRLIESVAD